MLWTASVDEVHDVEAIVRTVSGGVGGILWAYLDQKAFPTKDSFRILYSANDASITPPAQQTKASTFRRDNLNSSLAELLADGASCPDDTHCDEAGSDDWNNIDAYLRQVRSPRRPTQDLGGNPSNGKQIFEQARCNGCHGGPAWTLSKVFYTPSEENNGAMSFKASPTIDDTTLGKLRTTTYTVPDELGALNPPAHKTGSATVRRYAATPDGMTPDAYLYSAPNAANDQINCALRDVDTFPAQPVFPNVGRAAPGAPVVRELRQDMSTLAVGATGFNIPSLVGVGLGAPYFHAGNARTLEEALSDVFAGHRGALPSQVNFSSTDAIRDLVAYLLTIDDGTAPESVPTDLPYDLCATVTFR
jgi:hypothetical protein